MCRVCRKNSFLKKITENIITEKGWSEIEPKQYAPELSLSLIFYL